MHHMFHHQGVEFRILLLVWELGRNESVVLLRNDKLIGRIHDQQKVCVGEAPLLELDYVYMCDNNTQDILLEQHLFHSL